MQFELALIENGEEKQRYPIDRDEVLVGRSREADIVIDDKRVSRMHVSLKPVREGLSAEDLGSRNGIRINGEQTQSGWLNVGDLLEVGSHRFLVTNPDAVPAAIAAAEPAPPEHDDAAPTPLENPVSPAEAQPAPAAPPRGKNGSGRTVLAWAKAGELHHLIFDPPALWKELAKVVLGNIPGRRCFILARAPGAETLRVLAMHGVRGSGEGPSPNPIVIERAWRENKPSRLNPDESPEPSEGSAIVAVPLEGRDETIGVLYVDSGRESGAFSEGDLGMMRRLGKVFGKLVETALETELRLNQAKLAGAQAICGRLADYADSRSDTESPRELVDALRVYAAGPSADSDPLKVKKLVIEIAEDINAEFGPNTLRVETAEGLPIFAYANEPVLKKALQTLVRVCAASDGSAMSVAVQNTPTGCVIRVTTKTPLGASEQAALQGEILGSDTGQPVNFPLAAVRRAISDQGGAMTIGDGGALIEIRLRNRES